MGVESHSEFDSGGVMPSTVHPKPSEALTNSDRLRLMSLTGQETDTNAPVDPYFWVGNVPPDDSEERFRKRQEADRKRLLNREARNRYRKS